MASLAALHPTLPLPHAHHHPSHPNPTTGLLRLLPWRRPHRGPRRRGFGLAVSACAFSAALPSAAGRGDRSIAASSLERCLAASAPSSVAPASVPSRAPPAMKGGKQFGAVTLEKAKLDLSQRKKKIMPEEATFDIELPRRSLLVQFTCNKCDARTKRLINRMAYERGTVFLQCAGCQVYHKFVDNLGLIVEYDLREENEVNTSTED